MDLFSGIFTPFLSCDECSGIILDMKRPRHCGHCGTVFDADRANAKWCSVACLRKARWQQQKLGRMFQRHCKQCGQAFEAGRKGIDANRWHCSPDCSLKSARQSRSKFFEKNPAKPREYYAKSRKKLGPDGNLKRFYVRHPEAPRACQSCGEHRVLDVAHRPEHRRNGAWRSKTNTTLDRVWILCPTCHALLDRMHYPPGELGLV
jgi:hypothetical protein